ncbi:tigger transposable element-derived protein 6-like [Rhizophagus clarus]|uniref:Tigger transposable element-derived protein 6-like n=1 Tax=Rhizophagus clarus TaxID=94130 RepID=A0A8H3QID3_9GLOM|nr:tigger transposable element-derived protein 6-like [Rhizophagus clarus]
MIIIFFIFELFITHYYEPKKSINNEVILKKRKVLTFGEKKELCLFYNKNLLLSQEEIEKKFGLNKEKSELEEALTIWISNALSTNKTITGEIIIAKAFDFARLMNIKGFTGSSGPSEEKLIKEREKLQELINNFDLENVFNYDETELYWELEPSKTLSTGPLSEIKKSKNRVTLLLTFNATGSVKLPALFIHKYQTPRDLIGIDKSKLPVDYFWNKKILLLVDNASVHSVSSPELLTNITIHYLPPNTTAHLQPADAGIINSFKAQYRKRLIKNRIEAYDDEVELNIPVPKLKIGELMSAKEFILIDDDNNYGEEEITDEEIVNIIKSNKTDLVEEVINLQPKISTSEALESLDKVLSFLSNPPDNFVIEFNNRNLMHNFKKQIILFDKIVKFNQC